MPIPGIAALAARYAMVGESQAVTAGTYGAKATSGLSKAEAAAKTTSADATKKTTESTKEVTKETKAVGSAFDNFRNSARRATIDFTIAKAALSGLSQKAINLLTTPLDMLVDAAKPIQNLVALNSPALAERFTLVMRDAYGVIGRMLIPAMQVMTQLMRRLGDAYAKMEPILQPTIDSFSRMASQIGNQLISSLEKSGPLIAGIATSFEMLVNVLGPTETGIAALVTILQSAFGVVGLIGDASKRKADPNRSGMGAAVRSVGIGTSGEEISRQAQAKAFSQIVNEPGKKTQEDVPTILDDIKAFLIDNLSFDKIMKAISSLIPNTKDLPGGETLQSLQRSSPLGSFLQSLLTR